MLTFLRDAKVECMVLLAPPEGEGGGGRERGGGGPGPPQDEEGEEGGLPPSWNVTFFLCLSLVRPFLYAGAGIGEIREPYSITETPLGQEMGIFVKAVPVLPWSFGPHVAG